MQETQVSSPTTDNWPELREHLDELIGRLNREAPGPLSGFSVLRKKALAPGVLPGQVKELIALGIAVAAHCDGCVAYHVHDALRAGATRDEVVEAIGVAVMMGGGPAVIYGAKAIEALDQFETAA